MSAKHTPGPWQVHGSHVYTADPERALLAQVHNPGSKASDYPLIDNARLIAAAPEMLGVLQTTLGNIMSLGPAGALESVPMPYRVWADVVRAAIAKATGGEA